MLHSNINFCSIFLLLLCSCVQPEVDTASPTLPPVLCSLREYNITVFITDETGIPVTNAQVDLVDSNQNTVGVLELDQYNEYYRIHANKVGMYTIEIHAPGFQNKTLTGIQLIQNFCGFYGSDQMTTLQR